MGKTMILGAAVLLLVAGQEALGTLNSIPKSSFVQNTTYESFEENITWENAQVNPNGGVVPGTYSDYIFSDSQVRLTAPIPNTVDGYTQRITIQSADDDCGLGIYGRINSNSLIPDGTHYLIHAGGLYEPFELTFPQNTVMRVGGYWIIGGNHPDQDKIRVEAFGLDDLSLGYVLIPASNVGDWKNNFFGFEADDLSPIKKITIDRYLTGIHPGVDYLMFDYVPEPATLSLLALGGLGLLRSRKRSYGA